ncbi:MAG: LysM peptidoglycan-binding domain-containing protein [Planctomycetota bacterium]|jgi:LysM repeat protein
MSAGTKVTIAVVVLFATLLGVYYGFGGPGSEAAPDELPPADQDRVVPVPIDGSLPPQTRMNQDSSGVLSASVEQAIGEPGPATGKDFGVLASDGALPVISAEPKPPADGWVLAPKPAYPPAAPEKTPGYVDYTIREGDSMWTIADHWLGDASRWGAIADANPAIDPDRLRVGQRIRIPGADAPAAGPKLNTPARVPAADQAAGASFHTVRSGDTLSRIAQTHYRDATKWRAIFDANRTAIGGDPDRLEVGMRLRLPPA